MKNQTVCKFALVALCLHASSSLFAAIAQGDCPDDQYAEAWVDPFYGDDLTGTVGDITLPYRTLNGAIFDVDNAISQTTLLGLVHALPGLYSFASNGEQFPISMRPNVHVQGAGAKETVIRVRETDATRMVYWPRSSGLTRVPAQIAVDFTTVTSETMFDGFTLQGAKVQVYAQTESLHTYGRVSNCVFDMRYGGDEALMGPYFGQLTASIYEGEPTDYVPVTFYTFNNTFIQGWRFGNGEEDIDLARPAAVAICDLNDPSPPCGSPPCLEDDDLTIRGVNNLHIQNNLIRSLDGFPRTATLGIDAGDTEVLVPMATPTNAFNAGFAVSVSVDPAMTFSSAIVGAIPVPVVDLGPTDPGFVGEFLSDRRSEEIRDFRLLNDSVLVDMGQAPDFSLPDCNPTLIAANGLVYSGHRREDSALASFDFDGEVHGNPRIVNGLVDVGFDEVDALIIAGSYGNDTKSHHLSYDPTLGDEIPGVPLVPVGLPDRTHFHAAPTNFAYWLTFDAMAFPPGTTEWVDNSPWTHMPGALDFQLSLSIGLDVWVDFVLNFVNVGSFASTADSWTNWESGQAHSFATFTWTVDETQQVVTPSYLNNQAFNIGTTVVSSNLQSEYL